MGVIEWVEVIESDSGRWCMVRNCEVGDDG